MGNGLVEKVFQVRKVYPDGIVGTLRDGVEADLDESVLEQLYIPIKKYFVKKYQAPIALYARSTTTGALCLDFIGDARVPKDFNYERSISALHKVANIFVKSDYDASTIAEFKVNIGPCVSYLVGDRTDIKVDSNRYDDQLFDLVKELYPQ